MSSGEDTIVRQPKRYPSIGQCIYCGTRDTKRGEEHIVPRALAGNAIIFDDASCRDCEKMINKFEQPVLRQMLGPARMRFGAPSRKRKNQNRPTEWPLHIISGPPGDPSTRSVGVLTVPADQHPVGFVGLRLRPPPILTGAPIPPKVDGWATFDKNFMPSAIQSGAMRDGEAINVGQINPYKFAQFLAKIAYCFAVAETGYGSFASLMRPILDGSAEEWADVIGGDFDAPEAEPHLYHLHKYVVLGASARYLCVRIRLWGFLGTPVYRVVVGTL